MFNLSKKNQNVDTKYSARLGVTKAKRRDKTLSHPAFKALVVLNIAGALVAGYLYINREPDPLVIATETERRNNEKNSTLVNNNVSQVSMREPVQAKKEKKDPLILEDNS